MTDASVPARAPRPGGQALIPSALLLLVGLVVEPIELQGTAS